MRPQDRDLAQRIEKGLISHDREVRSLPGIRNSVTRMGLIEQMLESVRRVKYVSVVRQRNISERRTDPNDEMFDPVRAAVLQQIQGHIDEAFWLVFLFVHFGKHPRAGWRYAREVYGCLGSGGRWDWARVSADPTKFRTWLDVHQGELKREGVSRGFGNHRKYQSLDAYSPTGTGAAVESYVKWVGPPQTHEELVEGAVARANGDPRQAFDDLYRMMDAVVTFGRTARFDYLTMIDKLSLAPIKAGSTYMKGATGPFDGARLLFGTNDKAAKLDEWLVELDTQLNVGMQVLEDALCNWQKSPDKFKPFRS